MYYGYLRFTILYSLTLFFFNVNNFCQDKIFNTVQPKNNNNKNVTVSFIYVCVYIHICVYMCVYISPQQLVVM